MIFVVINQINKRTVKTHNHFTYTQIIVKNFIIIDKYRKAFYDIKNYRYLSISEIKKASKNLAKLKKRSEI